MTLRAASVVAATTSAWLVLTPFSATAARPQLYQGNITVLLHAEITTSDGLVSLTVRYDTYYDHLALGGSVLGQMSGTIACGAPGEKPFRRNVHVSSLPLVSLRKATGETAVVTMRQVPGDLAAWEECFEATRTPHCAHERRFPPAVAPRTFTVRFLDGQGGGMNRKTTTSIPGPGAGYPATVSAKLTRIVNVRPDPGFTTKKQVRPCL